MEIREYILKNQCLEIHVLNLGGIIKNIFVRDCRWHLTDVVLGLDTPEQYASPEYLAAYPYFGAIIGRYANRIQGAAFAIDGQTYHLDANERGNCLHGGFSGLDCAIWETEQPDDEHLVLHHVSPDGEGGFPGPLIRLIIADFSPDCKAKIFQNFEFFMSFYVQFTLFFYY